MNPVEVVAAAFGLICVWLTTRQSIWCWPAGLVQVSLYTVVFYEAKLYSDLILHCIYIILQIYGWYHWLHGGGKHKALRVSRMPLFHAAGWSLSALAGAGGWGFLMATYTDAALPYPDAFIISASLTAQWLMARKKIENWMFWIAVDIVAIGVYFLKGLYVTTGLYVVFLLLCILGFVEWRKSFGSTDKGSREGLAATA